jgi:hypothetical protein
MNLLQTPLLLIWSLGALIVLVLAGIRWSSQSDPDLVEAGAAAIIWPSLVIVGLLVLMVWGPFRFGVWLGRKMKTPPGA